MSKLDVDACKWSVSVDRWVDVLRSRERTFYSWASVVLCAQAVSAVYGALDPQSSFLQPLPINLRVFWSFMIKIFLFFFCFSSNFIEIVPLLVRLVSDVLYHAIVPQSVHVVWHAQPWTKPEPLISRARTSGDTVGNFSSLKFLQRYASSFSTTRSCSWFFCRKLANLLTVLHESFVVPVNWNISVGASREILSMYPCRYCPARTNVSVVSDIIIG